MSRKTIRIVLAAEAATFATAAALHFSVDPFPHAAVPESIIAVVLVVGAVFSRVRWAAFSAAAFALAGTGIGIAEVLRGAGPRAWGDLAYHVTIAAALAATLLIMAVRRAARR
jgi:hypothetical protein